MQKDPGEEKATKAEALATNSEAGSEGAAEAIPEEKSEAVNEGNGTLVD